MLQRLQVKQTAERQRGADGMALQTRISKPVICEKHADQVATGRRASDVNVVGTQAARASMPAQPGHRRAHLPHDFADAHGRRQRVIHDRDCNPVGRQSTRSKGVTSSRATTPVTAVDPQEHGPPRRHAIQVKLLTTALVIDDGFAIGQGLPDTRALTGVGFLLSLEGWHASAGVVLALQRGLVHAAVQGRGLVREIGVGHRPR